MGTNVFPALPGLGWSIAKQPEFSTLVRAATSGQETRVSLWAGPKWHFKLTYDLLRYASTFQELQSLAGFFLARGGQYDSFLFQDPDDHQVTSQAIGQGDGVTTEFQLLREFGGFAEAVRAPNLSATINIYVDGVLQSGSSYSVAGWGNTAPGMVTFNSAPASGKAVTADFQFYFPVRFNTDIAEFSQFMHQLWELKQIELITVFN